MNQRVLGVAIAAAGIITMILITPYDLPLITFLSEYQSVWFVELMSESLFELEKPGGGDIIVVFLSICFLLYCASSIIDYNCGSSRLFGRLQGWLLGKPGWSDTLRRHRLRLEFLVVSSFCCSTLMVKSLKWIMARPRPKKFFWGTRPFNEWYEIGPYFLDEGPYRASFPSGHTASAITLMGLAYVLMYTYTDTRRRSAGIVLMFTTLGFALAMALARVMSVAHWPTDVTFSVFGGWLLIHILFFYGFQFSTGRDGAGFFNGDCSPPPPFRGIRLCWYLSLFCLALVGLFIGCRHFFNDRWPWLILMSAAALPLLFYSIRKTADEGLFR